MRDGNTDCFRGVLQCSSMDLSEHERRERTVDNVSDMLASAGKLMGPSQNNTLTGVTRSITFPMLGSGFVGTMISYVDR